MFTRRDLFVAAAAALVAATAATLAQSPAKPVAHSCVLSWDSFRPVPTPAGSRRECFDAPTATLDRLECHVTTLNPGAVPHAAHQHPEEELVIVKEGELEAMQNGLTNRVTAGGLIFEASNERHGLRNPGTHQAVYYVIKFYPRDLPKPGTR